MCAAWRPPGRARLNDPEGTLWSRDADACCHFRKTVPLDRALEPFAAQITGRKRFQTRERADMQPVEFFDGRFRFNPLWQWTLAELEAYHRTHKLPRHPLVEDGYPSIGCMPCTRRVQAGEDYRAGRWSGLDKDECGIHSPTAAAFKARLLPAQFVVRRSWALCPHRSCWAAKIRSLKDFP